MYTFLRICQLNCFICITVYSNFFFIIQQPGQENIGLVEYKRADDDEVCKTV